MAGLLTCLVCAAAASAFFVHDRAGVLRQEKSELAAISFPAAGFVARGLVTLDLAVSEVTGDFYRAQVDLAGAYLRLRQQGEQFDQLEALRGVAVIDANGTIQYTTDVTRVGYNVADSSYFKRQRDGDLDGMAIGTPVTSQLDPDHEIVPVSWPLHDQDGRFAGVVAVGANWRLYAEIFASLTSQPKQIVALIDQAGRLYALDQPHWPDQEQEPARPAFLGQAAGLPSQHADDEVAEEYLVARAATQDFGMEVISAVPIEAVLKAWWQRLYLAVSLIVVISIFTGVLTGLLHRAMQALHGTATAAKVAADEAKAAQARAEEGEQAKTQFLAAMSHEIRTPMTGVLGMADLLAAERLDVRQQAYVRAIRTSGQHLLSVINDILDFSRFGAGGGVTLEQIDFSVAELLEHVRSIMAPQAAERGLRLNFDLDEHSPPVVRGDPTRLRQILVNLIGNGLKFTSTGGVHVAIRCTAPTAQKVWFLFAVEDTGIGIPQDRQRELFQAFTQADRSTARKYGGSGLGLAICRQLVTAMGGEISVQSTPGLGSRFSFQLLFEVGDVVLASEKVTLDPAAIPPLRILVAEDVAVNRDLLHAILNRHGHAITFAENGQQAVAQVQAQGFDLVLMDVQMPVMDGIEATRRIRALPLPKGAIPIVALTANVMETERQHCLAAGMNRVLTKPVAWDELFQTLAAVTGHSMSTRVAPPKQPAEPPPALATALLDHIHIDGLGKMAGPAKLIGFLHNAMLSAEQLAKEMERLQDDPAELTKRAHRLAGTAPSFGLLRIGAIGRAIEQDAGAGCDVRALVIHLQEAIADTKDELQRRQLLPAH